jgi:hypothetical protein
LYSRSQKQILHALTNYFSNPILKLPDLYLA